MQIKSNDDLYNAICSDKRGVNSQTLEQVVRLAVEIAREGREGRKIGTLFTVGDHAAVLEHSRPLILDPLYGHAEDVKHITQNDMRETAKELAQLDGAFVLSNGGVFLSAARYLNADTRSVNIPLGLGSRHMAGASISLRTDAVAVVVSESSVVRLFDDGDLVAEIIPELWMLRQYASPLGARVEQSSDEQVTVLSKHE